MQFPWSAVVGQDALKRALTLCAIDPAIGGVLVHGPRGVAKTTLARALAELVPGKFVELPLGATEERVTGAIDLERALQDGRVEFAPGLLARAHDGVLYVDEVNLLPDALVDLLLDAAATGRNVVERDGVSHTHPAKFVLVGSMNPEEGELRPQLIDRFGLSASAQGLIPPAERAEIVTRRLAFDRDPEAFRAKYAAEQQALYERCKRARELANRIELGGAALARVTERCHAAGVEGIRADLAMLRAARAHAAWNGREQIAIEDVDAVADLALAHRRPKGEGEPPRGGAQGSGGGGGGASSRPSDPSHRSRAADGGSRFKQASSEAAAAERSAQERGARSEHLRADARANANANGAPHGKQPERSASDDEAQGAVAARPVQAIGMAELPPWLTAATGKRASRNRRGKASAAAESGARARSLDNRGAIDWFATLSRAGRKRRANPGLGSDARSLSADCHSSASRSLAGRLSRFDLRYRARRAPSSQLWILAVDCSSSMLRSGGLAIAKGFAASIERGARRAGARLAVVSFRGVGARIEVDSSPGRAVLPRTIAALGGGGGTPLSAALVAAGSLCKQSRWRAPGVFTRLLLLTDGRVRDPRGGIPPLPGNLDRVVVDCERGRVRLGRAQQLSAALHASYYRPTQA